MQCKATSRSGKQCARHAIAGGRVCTMHGGAAPQVRKSAALRLAELVDPAIGVIHERIQDKKRPDLALKAALDVLDRNGHKSPDKLELSNAEGQEFNLNVLSLTQLEQFAALFTAVSSVSGIEAPSEEQD